MDLLWHGLTQAFQLIGRNDLQLRQATTLSLMVSGIATLLAALIGIPVGIVLAVVRFHGRPLVNVLVNTGMGLPPVVVGLLITIFLWRSGPFGALNLLYTPSAMVLAQFVVAAPLVAGFTRSAVELLDPDILEALRVDGAGALILARELIHASLQQLLVAVAAGFGRAIAEVGASLMVGGNILGQTRILTTAITLQTGRGDFALAIALGLVLLTLAFLVNLILAMQAGRRVMV